MLQCIAHSAALSSQCVHPHPTCRARSYQRRRMYTRIALGKSSAMDVVGGESSASTGQLWVLYPMLFTLQGLQVRVRGGCW